MKKIIGWILVGVPLFALWFTIHYAMFMEKGLKITLISILIETLISISIIYGSNLISKENDKDG